MRKFTLLLLLVLLLAGCTQKTVDADLQKAETPTATPTTDNQLENWNVSLTLDELSDVSDWEWKAEYGYFITDNHRMDYLTIWYDPFEQSYSLDHPYSSLSDEHIINGSKVFPINKHYTNENGNTFIPFIFTDLKHPDYEADGDGVFWLLYENYNGNTFLDYYSQDAPKTVAKHILP